MAATLGDDVLIKSAVDEIVEEAYYTTLEPSATVTHSHKGPSGVAPNEIYCIVTQRATTRDPVFFSWDESANSTTSDTVALQFDTLSGGDLGGAQVKVIIKWFAHASGGIS
jgi:hypothetical protein